LGTAFALVAALSLPAAATGDLRLSDVRPTHCVLGPVRAADKVLPGDSYVLSFDIEGIALDDAGKARYSVGVDVTDADGKPLFKQEPKEQEAQTSLGGARLPAYAQINVGLEARPGTAGPTVYLTPGLTAKLSLTTGQTSSGVGLLKNGPKLQWPDALQDDAFDKPRTDIERLMKTAYDQVTTGQVDYKVIRQIKSDCDQIDATLKAKIEEMTPNDNIRGKRYVRELRDTVQALQQPDVSSYFAACRPIPASTVGQLVQGMSAKGLTFAPAQAGAEPAYNALYSSLVTYYKALTQPTLRATQ
jgi:hypothetical protein